MLWGGWGERKRERAGHDGKGCFPFFFLWGYPAEASAEERARLPSVFDSPNQACSCKDLDTRVQTAKPLISFDDYTKNIPGHIAAIDMPTVLREKPREMSLACRENTA